MKKFLPIFIFLFLFGFFFSSSQAFAQATPPNQQMQQGQAAPDNSWVIDPEVTFIGKNAARSGNLLDFILKNYNWVCVTQTANGQCDNSNNPLAAVWLTTVTYIVVPLLFIVVIATAIVIVVTRGRSLTIMRFLPRFVAVILLIFFSFALLQFFYQFTDVIQGFFLRNSAASCPPTCISQKDLLFVGWDYKTFIGLRLTGDQNSESAFISLLLTKLTAITYFVMVGILTIRKIILWLFIIVSPIFPLLLLYYPVRNTGKIWIGEFFRWLLYAPLFAIFLKGLVSLWRNQIPLTFIPKGGVQEIGDAGKIIYPTAINILLGGPKQFVTQTNSVNLTETFALYVVSLLMLWGVIILPWILLQIFLDYASNLAVGDSAVMKNLVNIVNTRQIPPSPAGYSPASSGSALTLPFAKKFSMPPAPSAPTGMTKEIPIGIGAKTISNVSDLTINETHLAKAAYMPSAQVKAQTLSLVNMSIPSLRDVAKYDTSMISRDKDKQKETTVIRENLEKIANPASSTSTTERERYTEIREKLTQQSKEGNTLATSILSAANNATKRSVQANTSQIKNILTQIANPSSVTSASTSSTSISNRDKLMKMNQSLTKAKQEGNVLAASILSVTAKTPDAEISKLQEKITEARLKGNPIAAQIAAVTQKIGVIPVVNRVQTVNKEDYEAVKQMWKENYKNLEVPQGMAGTREEWVKDDIAKIDNIIVLLSSKDEEKMSQGMEEVSSILPFLLVGGFSQTEIIAYLKAKQDAAKEVTAELSQEEEDKVSVSVKKTATTQQAMSASLPQDSGDEESDLTNLSSRATSVVNSQVSNEILQLVNLKLPNMRDIAKYETMALSKDKSKVSEIEKVHEVLQNIANPTGITNASDREHYEKLKEKIVEASQQGNITAEIILAAASGATPASATPTSTQTKTVLSQIANPSLAASQLDKERFTALHDQLTKASQQGNSLAASLLTVKESATKEEVEKLNSQLGEAKVKGESFATSILSTIAPPVSLPSTNRIQTVSQDDYQAVKDMWKENYQNLEIPQGLAATRSEWINNDITKIDSIITQLSSTDKEQVTKGMEEVSSILPFLLVGGFSQTEIIAYLKAKQDAAKEIIAVISQEEDTKVTVEKKQINIKQTMAADIPQVTGEEDISSGGPTKNIVVPQVSEKMLTMANLQLPKLIRETLEATAAQAQRSLDLERGPLMRVVLFECGEGSPQRLLLAIHHLSVDGISWRVLLEDLQRGYAQAEEGAEVDLGSKGTSWKEWAGRLREWARGAEAGSEADYWLAETGGGRGGLPRDFDAGDNSGANAEVVTVQLSEDETRALLTEVPSVYRTQVNDALLSALAETLCKWSGGRVLVELEGHGREELFEAVDVSRTSGWFTARYPVALEAAAGDGPGELLKRVKEKLRGVPRKGVGYGALKYLREDETVVPLRARPEGEVSFNYLGYFYGPFGGHGRTAGRGARIFGGQPRPETAARATPRRERQRRRRALADELALRPRGSQTRDGRGAGGRLHGVAAAARPAQPRGRRRGGLHAERLPSDRNHGGGVEVAGRHAPRCGGVYPLSPMQQGMLNHSLTVESGATSARPTSCSAETSTCRRSSAPGRT